MLEAEQGKLFENLLKHKKTLDQLIVDKNKLEPNSKWMLDSLINKEAYS